MSTYFAGGCKDEKAHVCDCCKNDDGRPTLYWKDKDFDLCHECLEKLSSKYLDPIIKWDEKIQVIRARISEETRNRIFKRDGYECVKCGCVEDLCLDHIKPFSRGGTTDENNLQTLCKTCNARKGKK